MRKGEVIRDLIELSKERKILNAASRAVERDLPSFRIYHQEMDNVLALVTRALKDIVEQMPRRKRKTLPAKRSDFSQGSPLEISAREASP